MEKKFYLYVYCLTGEVVLTPDAVFKYDELFIEKIITKLIKYNIFNKIHVLEFDKNFPEHTKEFTIYSILDRKNLSVKKSASNELKAYIYFLSCLIATKIHSDIYLENDDISDSKLKILDKINADCISNYKNFNILNDDSTGFITVPDRVNELLDDLNVLKYLKVK